MKSAPPNEPSSVKYRVSYVESILREAVIEAASAEEAEALAHQEQKNAAHHHAIDVWIDDWAVEKHKPHVRTINCFECGERT